MGAHNDHACLPVGRDTVELNLNHPSFVKKFLVAVDKMTRGKNELTSGKDYNNLCEKFN